MPRLTTFAPPVAHLVGPGELRFLNNRLFFHTPQEKASLRLDVSALKCLFVYGSVSFSDQALETLLRNGIETAIFSTSGQRCYGRLVGEHDSSTLLRVGQHQALRDPRAKLALARSLVTGKLESMRDAARHYQRHGVTWAGQVRVRLLQALNQATTASDLAVLRGVEGAATASWFELLGQLLHSPWEFKTRRRHPPPDPVNSLLSLGYTWLLERTIAKLRAAGLEIALGALHEFHPGRPSLGCDVMEPFRVPGVDRWVVTICRENHLDPREFQSTPEGVRLPTGKYGEMLSHWEQTWSTAGLETALDRRVAQLCGEFRTYCDSPNPHRICEPGGGLGGSTTQYPTDT